MAHQPCLNVFVVRGSLYRVSNGGEECVGKRGFRVLDRGLDVRYFLALVTPDDEHAGLNAPFPTQPDRLAYLLQLDASLHGIEDPLRSAFRADPHSQAAEVSQFIRHVSVEAVCASSAFEWDPDS